MSHQPLLGHTSFVKGHGAENDFVIVPDPEGHLILSSEQVKRLCDRRVGIGADGLLRAVRCTADIEGRTMSATAAWFMDYRNADGSKASMCGNGIRLMALYLVQAGHCRPGHFTIATRAGTRTVHVPAVNTASAADISVLMGRPRLPRTGPISVAVGQRRWPALHVDMGNPHAVTFIDDLSHVGGLHQAPLIEPAHAYPNGATVEFAALRGPRHLVVRVHERGVGETRACGTGACAAVAAALQREGSTSSRAEYIVDLPGGRLYVARRPGGTMQLTGPAALTADGTLHNWPEV